MTTPRFEDSPGGASGTPLATRGRTTSGHVYQRFLFRDTTSGSNPIPTDADSVIQVRADGTPEHRLLTSGADYWWTTAAHDIDEAAMSFLFRPPDGVSSPTKAAGVCLAVSRQTGAAAVNANGVFSNSIHCAFGPDLFRCTLMINDGVNPAVIASPFESGDMYVASGLGLPTDGTPLSVIIKRTARDRIRVIIPGYLDEERRDSRIPDIWGSTVGHEHLRYTASYATDAEPIILGVRPGPPVRRPRSASAAALMSGVPGGHSSGAPAAAPFASGFTCYWPLDFETPVTVNSLMAEVVAAYPAGAVASWALLSADAAWQPKKLLADLGATMALDSTGIKTLTPAGGIAVAARRALLGLKVSNWASGATLRTFPHALPTFPNVRTTLGAGPFVSYMTAIEAYGAWPTTPVGWNASAVGALPGFLFPAVLQWTEN